jgi:hypothetical protein
MEEEKVSHGRVCPEQVRTSSHRLARQRLSSSEKWHHIKKHTYILLKLLRDMGIILD